MPFLTQYSMARLPWPYGSAILVPRALIPLSGYLTGRGNNRYFFLHQIVARSERGCLPGDRVYGFPIRLPISREPGERRIDVESSGGTLAGHGSCVSAASPCRNLHSIGGRPRWYGSCEAFTPSPACALSGGAGRARRTRGARTPRFLDDRIDAIPVTRMVRYVPDCIRNRIGDGLVEPDTLPLQPRRPMRPGNFHAAIVSPPAAVTRVRYNKTPACLADCPALAGAGACFPQHPNERLGFACLSVCASLSSMVRIEAVARNQGGSLSRIQHTRHCSFANGRNRSASLNARKPPPNSVPQIRAGTLRLHPRFHQRTHCLGGQALIRGGKRILAACRACRCTEQYSLRTNRPCKRVKQRDMFEAA